MTRFKKLLAAALTLLVFAGPTFAAELRAIPPNMIGLILTPTGFDGKIYPPGQIDIGNESWSGYGNKLLLIQRSGFAIKEQFGRNDPSNANDLEDHRCTVGPDREPMTLDVRLLFALPDYNTEAGKAAILRMGLLGNPDDLGSRVMVLDAASVYVQQVQQQVRGKIRDLCLSYGSVEDVYKAVEKDGDEGFSEKLTQVVAETLAENQSPLFLVAAFASNIKPDPRVVDAIAAEKAAEKLVLAMKKIDDFIAEDPTGRRANIFKIMSVQTIVAKAGETGHNTIFMTDFGDAKMPMVPVPTR